MFDITLQKMVDLYLRELVVVQLMHLACMLRGLCMLMVGVILLVIRSMRGRMVDVVGSQLVCRRLGKEDGSDRDHAPGFETQPGLALVFACFAAEWSQLKCLTDVHYNCLNKINFMRYPTV